MAERGAVRKVVSVAVREFRATVLTKGFVLGVVLAPVIGGAAMLIAGWAAMQGMAPVSGTLAILEFSLPANRVVRGLYLWYFRRVLPVVGNAVARNASDAYTYLNQSVEAFPTGEALAALIRPAGFDRIESIPLTLGIATLSICRREG